MDREGGPVSNLSRITFRITYIDIYIALMFESGAASGDTGAKAARHLDPLTNLTGLCSSGGGGGAFLAGFGFVASAR